MRLRKLIEGVDLIHLAGGLEKEIDSLYYDSRRVEPRSLFVAIRGFRQDGHDFIPQALRAASKFIPLTHVVNLLQGLWFGNPLGQHVLEVAILAGLLVLGVAVSAKAFRWE